MSVTTIQTSKKNKTDKIVSPYVRFEHGDIVMSESAKPYVLKIKDLPLESQPREKMIAHGSGALSLTELLSIVLVSGTKKEDVTSIASRVIREYGTSTFLNSGKTAEELSCELDIPLTKACQIIAVGELGKRLFSKNLNSLAVLRAPEDVYEYVKDMHNLPKEQFRGLYLDTHHKVIHDEVLSIGTINASMVHPREVFKPAVEYGAAAIILVHNHPSGVSTPSESDIQVTQKLVQVGKMLGIPVLDHVVVTRTDFTSVPADY